LIFAVAGDAGLAAINHRDASDRIAYITCVEEKK